MISIATNGPSFSKTSSPAPFNFKDLPPEADISGVNPTQSQLDYIAKCMEGHNSLDFCAYRLGELLAQNFRGKKISNRAEDPEGSLKASEEKTKLHNPVNVVGKLSIEGQQEYKKLIETYTELRFDFKNPIHPNRKVLCHDGFKRTPFDLAAKYGSYNLLKEMLAKIETNPNNIVLPGQDTHDGIEKAMEVFSYSLDENFGNYLLHEIVKGEHYDLLERFLDEHGKHFSGAYCQPNFNSLLVPGDCFELASTLAGEKEDYRALKIFIEKGHQLKEGLSPLEVAAKKGDYIMVKTLLEDETVVSKKWVEQALKIAEEKLASARIWIVRAVVGLFTDVPSIESLQKTIALLEEKRKAL